MPPTEPPAGKAPPTSTTLREEGNAFYKSGNLAQACKKYMEAIKADPTDPIPPRNLSASYYELGIYTKSISTAKEAITLLGSNLSLQDQAHREKLEARISKAEIHNFKSTASKKEAREKILAELPRYKPSMFTGTEYFTVGHDVVTSIFEADHFQAFAPDAKQVSFFLGGVGDARTVLQTVAVISEAERLKGSPKRNYHFTVNDIAKSALARNLVVWMLLERVAVAVDADESELVVNTLFFVYLSTMMPRYAFEMLEETISNAIEALKKGESPLKWLFLHKKDIPSYIAALKHWLGEGKEIFTSSEIIDKVSDKMRGTTRMNAGTIYKNEKSLYLEAAVLFPSKKVLELHDPNFLALMERYSRKPKYHEAVQTFKDHLTENWHFNTTLLDKEWFSDLQGKALFDVGYDPFESLDHFPYDEVTSKPMRPDRLFEHMKPFFLDTAKAIKYLGERLKIEAVLGDYVDFAEKVQFGLYDPGARPAEFPVLYERIHLSNVPDYTHGHLTTFLHAMPLLRRGLDANLRATCLRNSDSWQTVEDYLADYNQIPDTGTLSALSQIQVLIRENTQMAYPMADYTFYTWSTAGPHIFSSLLPRKKFTKWFYSLFFRLALPMTLDLIQNMKIIFSPLNLCVLLRLITQLRSFGYPSHWLSEPLLHIIHNTVITTARPPRTKPMRPVDVKREYRERKLCTAPFSHELAVLARLFQPLLPFRLTSSAIPDSSDIYKYSFHLPGYENIAPQPSCLVLVFMKESLFPDSKAPASVLFNLRIFLDPSTDEMGDKKKFAKVERFRDEGVRVWSSFQWDKGEKVAGVWMGEGMVGEMVEGRWSVGIWRTDIWMPVCVPQLVGLEGVVSKGARWA